MNSESLYIALIYISVIIALAWAIFCAYKVVSIKLDYSNIKQFDEVNDEKSKLVLSEKMININRIGNLIAKGANSFLRQEYTIMTIFIVIFSIVVLVVVDILGQEQSGFRCYATFAFIIGSFASMVCGFIGMRIAVVSNYRTTYKALHSLEDAFRIAY